MKGPVDKIEQSLGRIADLRRQIEVMQDPEAQWFRWKEIEMRFQALALLAAQQGEKVYKEADGRTRG